MKRVGGRVEITETRRKDGKTNPKSGAQNREAYIAKIDPNFGRAQVVLIGEPDKTLPRHVEIDKLKAVCEIPSNPSFFPLESDFFSALMFFVRNTSHAAQHNRIGSDGTNSWASIYAQLKSCAVLALTSLLQHPASALAFVERGMIVLLALISTDNPLIRF